MFQIVVRSAHKKRAMYIKNAYKRSVAKKTPRLAKEYEEL